MDSNTPLTHYDCLNSAFCEPCSDIFSGNWTAFEQPESSGPSLANKPPIYKHHHNTLRDLADCAKSSCCPLCKVVADKFAKPPLLGTVSDNEGAVQPTLTFSIVFYTNPQSSVVISIGPPEGHISGFLASITMDKGVCCRQGIKDGRKNRACIPLSIARSCKQLTDTLVWS